MPRLSHQPPKYAHHKASGQACVSLCGRRLYLGKHGSDKSYQRYQEVLREWERLRREAAGPAPPPAEEERLAEVVSPDALRRKRRQGSPVTLDELIFVYRRHARAYYVKRGRVTREAELVVEVTKLLGLKHGDADIESFGPVDLDNFRDDLISDRDWSRQHINKQVRRIVAMFKWAVSKEICSPEVHGKLAALAGLKKGRCAARETPGVSSIDDAVVVATIPFLPEIVADMVRFQRLTGARPGEVCSLRPADIDRSGDVWVYVPDEHKTEHHEKQRRVYIGPKAQAVIAPYLLRAAESYCFSPRETVARARRRQQEARRHPVRSRATKSATPKWTPAERYQVSSYRMAVRRASKQAGVEVWTPGRLRHTTATEVRKKYGLEAAQVICGHQTANVTQVYAERDRRLAERVAREVG